MMLVSQLPLGVCVRRRISLMAEIAWHTQINLTLASGLVSLHSHASPFEVVH